MKHSDWFVSVLALILCIGGFMLGGAVGMCLLHVKQGHDAEAGKAAQMMKIKIMEGAWRKGALHAHTIWSDGRSLPERAINAVKKAGYSFWGVTEHNFFPGNGNTWRELCENEGNWPPQLSFEEFVAARDIVPGYPKTTPAGTWKTLVKLMTFQEMCEAFNEPDKFLLIPGSEFTPQDDLIKDGRCYNVHANWLNITKAADLPLAETIPDSLDRFYQAYRKEAERTGRETCFIVNHPFWPFFDVLSTYMIDRPEFTLAEICNGTALYPMPDTMPGIERWWDGANTFRIAEGKPCIYGIASDDAHFYDDDRATHELGGIGGGFIVVHLPGHMTADRIIRAVKNGDFYASSGAYFDSIIMDYEKGILKVKVRKTDGATKCHIRFNGTKRGFDRTVQQRYFAFEGNPQLDRDVPVYSEDVGKILAETDGWTAEYKLAPDDLYVRATAVLDVESQRRNLPPDKFYPHHFTAWTQPMIPRQKSK